jgi:hypothetical protein
VKSPEQALGPRRRLLDGLVGAVVALVLLALVVVGALWWWGRSADAPSVPDPGAAPPPAAAPDDLGPDETWLADVQLGSGDLRAPDGALTDVTATGTDVRFGPDGMLAGRLDVEATVPFDRVAAGVGEGVSIEPADDGRASLRRTVELLGREVGVVATGTVRAEDGLIVVEPQRIDVGGPDFLAGPTAAVVRGLVTIRQPVEGVPEGLVLQQVTVQDDGFRALLSGEDVRLDG